MEFGIDSKAIVICPKKNIVLQKLQDGKFKIYKELGNKKMQILDEKRQLFEQTVGYSYKKVEHNMMVSKFDY